MARSYDEFRVSFECGFEFIFKVVEKTASGPIKDLIRQAPT